MSTWYSKSCEEIKLTISENVILSKNNLHSETTCKNARIDLLAAGHDSRQAGVQSVLRKRTKTYLTWTAASDLRSTWVMRCRSRRLAMLNWQLVLRWDDDNNDDDNDNDSVQWSASLPLPLKWETRRRSDSECLAAKRWLNAAADCQAVDQGKRRAK